MVCLKGHIDYLEKQGNKDIIQEVDEEDYDTNNSRPSKTENMGTLGDELRSERFSMDYQPDRFG